MKLQHLIGLFDDRGDEYYLEYTESPFKLVCVYWGNFPDKDISSIWTKRRVDRSIEDGRWVELILGLCPICEKGNHHSMTGFANAEYKGTIAPVEYHFSKCNACGSELVGAEMASLNKQAAFAFHKRVDDNNV